MEGHAKVEAFDHIRDDPATAPLLQQMRGADGQPCVCDHVWISYLTGTGEANSEGTGKLTAGSGSRPKPAGMATRLGRNSPSVSPLIERCRSRYSSSRPREAASPEKSYGSEGRARNVLKWLV